MQTSLDLITNIVLFFVFFFFSVANPTDVDGANAQGYDTGIGGSTSTIVSPLGSPQPQLRSHAQRNAALARYMQVSAYSKILFDIHHTQVLHRPNSGGKYLLWLSTLQLQV